METVKINFFQKNLEEGYQAEQALKRKLHQIVFVASVQQISWEESPFAKHLQRNGIDGIAETRTFSYDVKVRNYSYYRFKDILIETMSKIESQEPGWWYYSKCDFIVYVWKDPRGDYLIDGYIIFIQDPKLRDWFEDNKETFYHPKPAMTRTNNGKEWHTDNLAPRINQFPEETIIQFDPKLPITNQKFFQFMSS